MSGVDTKLWHHLSQCVGSLASDLVTRQAEQINGQHWERLGFYTEVVKKCPDFFFFPFH